MIRIEIKDTRLQAALAKTTEKAKATLPLMREIAGIMHDEVEQNFEEQGRPGWAPLKPSTVKARARRGKGPTPILQDSGQLANHNMSDATEDRAWVSNNKAYAAIQQFGGTITLHPRSSLFAPKRAQKGKFTKGREEKANAIPGGKGKSTFGTRTIIIPARPFLKLTEGGLQKILNAVKAFFSLGNG